MNPGCFRKQEKRSSKTSGGDASIPPAILGVKKEYLEAAFDEMETKYGTIEKYFSEGLGTAAAAQKALRDLYLGKR